MRMAYVISIIYEESGRWTEIEMRSDFVPLFFLVNLVKVTAVNLFLGNCQNL